MFGSTAMKEKIPLFQNAEKRYDRQVIRELKRDYVPVGVEFKRDPVAAKKLRRKNAVIVGCGIAIGIAAAGGCYAAGKHVGEAAATNHNVEGGVSDAALANTFDYSDV